MEEKELRNLQAGVEAIRGAADEANTIAFYIERLIATAAQTPEGAEEVKGQYFEIVKDELNHLLRFVLNVFVPLTGIEPDMDGLEESI